MCIIPFSGITGSAVNASSQSSVSIGWLMVRGSGVLFIQIVKWSLSSARSYTMQESLSQACRMRKRPSRRALFCMRSAIIMR
ncbi:hypothetical protein D3C81_2152010 [compost metagenome]